VTSVHQSTRLGTDLTPLAGCGKMVLEVPSDIAIALCDASTHAKVTE
jgi:hypothetical protein